MKSRILVSAIFIGALLLSGCSSNASEQTESGQSAAMTAAASETLAIYGSVSALPLMMGLTDAYKASAAGITFSPSAVGKDASIQALTSGEAALAMFEGSTVDVPSGAQGEAVAYEAVAVVVNPSCGVTSLTSQQLTAIFTGESDDWADFGGTGKITLVMPDKTDSFRQYFEEAFSTRAAVDGIMQSLIPETAVISTDVAADVTSTEGAIGICPAGGIEDLKSTVSIDGVALSSDSLKDGTYAASCQVILAASQNASESAKAFYTYCLADEAKEIIKAAGFTPLT